MTINFTYLNPKSGSIYLQNILKINRITTIIKISEILTVVDFRLTARDR